MIIKILVAASLMFAAYELCVMTANQHRYDHQEAEQSEVRKFIGEDML